MACLRHGIGRVERLDAASGDRASDFRRIDVECDLDGHLGATAAWTGLGTAGAPAAPVSFPNPFLRLGDIQLTFAPLFGGFEVNWSFYQLADWILGWFYIDIAKDDSRNYTPVGPTER